METFDTVVPVEQCNIKVIQTLAEDIANGKYNVGVMITPQDFKTTKLVNGEIQEEKYSVHGRKIPLLDIRKEMFEKHQDFIWMLNSCLEIISNCSKIQVTLHPMLKSCLEIISNG